MCSKLQKYFDGGDRINIEIFAILEFYAAQIAVLLPIGCAKKSATKYQSKLLEVPHERNSDLHPG